MDTLIAGCAFVIYVLQAALVGSVAPIAVDVAPTPVAVAPAQREGYNPVPTAPPRDLGVASGVRMPTFTAGHGPGGAYINAHAFPIRDCLNGCSVEGGYYPEGTRVPYYGRIKGSDGDYYIVHAGDQIGYVRVDQTT